MSITVNLDLREIYKVLCEECRKKVKELVARKISERLADQAIGVEEG